MVNRKTELPCVMMMMKMIVMVVIVMVTMHSLIIITTIIIIIIIIMIITPSAPLELVPQTGRPLPSLEQTNEPTRWPSCADMPAVAAEPAAAVAPPAHLGRSRPYALVSTPGPPLWPSSPDMHVVSGSVHSDDLDRRRPLARRPEMHPEMGPSRPWS